MLINNAGFGSMGEFAKLDLARELNMIDLNIKSLVELTYKFLAPMRERKRGRNHQRSFYRRISGGAFHGDLRRYESVCAFIFRSACGKRTGLSELR